MSIDHLPNIDPCPADENTPGGRCNDCLRRVGYDLETDTYVHLDAPDVACFLVAARPDLARRAALGGCGGGEQLVAVVETDAGNVDVLLGRDADGGQYVRICGNGCDLEGEQPGVYYPQARHLEAPR